MVFDTEFKLNHREKWQYSSEALIHFLVPNQKLKMQCNFIMNRSIASGLHTTPKIVRTSLTKNQEGPMQNIFRRWFHVHLQIHTYTYITYIIYTYASTQFSFCLYPPMPWLSFHLWASLSFSLSLSLLLSLDIIFSTSHSLSLCLALCLYLSLLLWLCFLWLCLCLLLCSFSHCLCSSLSPPFSYYLAVSHSQYTFVSSSFFLSDLFSWPCI